MNSVPMWELHLVTEHAVCDLLLPEEEARKIIKDWATWAERSANEWDDAEVIGTTYRDKEELLVRIIEGWYEVEVEEQTELKPGKYGLAKTVVAYRYRDIVAMSTKYRGDYGSPGEGPVEEEENLDIEFG